MKTLITLFFVIITSTIFSQTAVGPEIYFDTEVYDFGKVNSKDTLEARFYFKNTGTENLVITNVKPGCGCTVASFPKEPIRPGEGNVIVLKYHPSSEGPINKSATVTSNSISEPDKVIRIKGEVIK